MESHFTYSGNTDFDTLTQGDILIKNEGIELILKEVHPHYLKKDYKYFIVLTQSCDLVRRSKNKCKARYISIAAVRPFNTVLNRELNNHRSHWVEKDGLLCSSENRNKLYGFLNKLLNNNQPDYFYLHEDDSNSFPESMCAFLRLSVAIRAEDHYQACLDAKTLELREEFKAKLGWLSGNLYSRVGTMDWTPTFKTNAEFKKIINELLDKNALWIEKNVKKMLIKKIDDEKINSGNLKKEEIHTLLKEIHIPSKKEKRDKIFNHIKTILEKPGYLNEKQLKTIMKRITNDQLLLSQLK